MKLLYVEDDENLGFVTQENLERAGYQVRHCVTGTQAWEAFQEEEVDLCILDVMLPEMDGFDLATRIRQRDTHVPILFLTARNQKEDRITGFQLGGDDYLAKPFSIEELILRIQAILRRSQSTAASTPTSEIRLGALCLIPSQLMLRSPVGEDTLTQKECDLLAYILVRPNQVIRREQVLQDLWGKDDYFLGRSLDVFLSRVRKFISPDPSLQLETLHGVGFRLKA